jgi:hypothetical protein
MTDFINGPGETRAPEIEKGKGTLAPFPSLNQRRNIKNHAWMSVAHLE